MPQIRCYYEDCVFLKKGYCSLPGIELDPDDGCLKFSEDQVSLVKDYYEDEETNDSWEEEGYEELDFQEDDEDY